MLIRMLRILFLSVCNLTATTLEQYTLSYQKPVILFPLNDWFFYLHPDGVGVPRRGVFYQKSFYIYDGLRKDL